LAFIALNKNGWLSYKNINVMIGTTSPQFTKYATRVIIFTKIKPIPPLKMGRKTS
jgi:hypothetical protein